MSEQTDIPKWALKRADQIERRTGATNNYRNALARYIAQNEKEPVDPLLLEAREIAAQWDESRERFGGAQNLRAGKSDACEAVQLTLAGLRRGIEIGRQG